MVVFVWWLFVYRVHVFNGLGQQFSQLWCLIGGDVNVFVVDVDDGLVCYVGVVGCLCCDGVLCSVV